IAPLMQTAQRDVVERERFSARVDAGMTGARTTAAVLALLPVLGVGLGELIGAEPLSFLLSSGAGGWLLVIGVTLVCAGMLWSDAADKLLRLARRRAPSGAAPPLGAADPAAKAGDAAAAAATASAQRASVLIAGPRGLGYLPAFVCLGIVHVVAGLAGSVLVSG